MCAGVFSQDARDPELATCIASLRRSNCLGRLEIWPRASTSNCCAQSVSLDVASLPNTSEEGNVHTIQRIGEDILQPEKGCEAEVLERLKHAASLGSPFAMETLAHYYWDRGAPNGPGDSLAEYWIGKAIELGYREAEISLALRLMDGEEPQQNPCEALRLLRNAAERGSTMAGVLIATYVMSGQLDLTAEDAAYWLRQSGVHGAEHICRAGLTLYLRSVKARTRFNKRHLAQQAAVLFHEAHRCGSAAGASYLAYVIRRREIDHIRSCPGLDELLGSSLRSGNPFGRVNSALRLAAGIECATDWVSADRCFAELRGSCGILEWWLARSEEGDPEGHLVMGWLNRHHLSVEAGGFSLFNRMQLAAQGGWDIPQWMIAFAAETRGE